MTAELILRSDKTSNLTNEELDGNLLALATDFAGDDDPADSAKAYSKWADTANGLIKRRNAAGTAWVVEGRLLARSQQQYDQGSEPTTDQGDIWINGIGACRWNSTDSKYYRIPYQTKEVITSSGSWVVPAYVNALRLSGSAGGCAGVAGTVNIASGAGGGAGQVALEVLTSVTASDSLSIVIGAGGASSGAIGGDTSVTNSTTSELLMQLTGGATYSKGSDPTKGGLYSDWGGAGQSSAFGIGGVAGNSSRNGGNAIGNGAGGGGGGASSTGATPGGSGAAGIVIIEF